MLGLRVVGDLDEDLVDHVVALCLFEGERGERLVAGLQDVVIALRVLDVYCVLHRRVVERDFHVFADGFQLDQFCGFGLYG